MLIISRIKEAFNICDHEWFVYDVSSTDYKFGLYEFKLKTKEVCHKCGKKRTGYYESLK